MSAPIVWNVSVQRTSNAAQQAMSVGMIAQPHWAGDPVSQEFHQSGHFTFRKRLEVVRTVIDASAQGSQLPPPALASNQDESLATR